MGGLGLGGLAILVGAGSAANACGGARAAGAISTPPPQRCAIEIGVRKHQRIIRTRKKTCHTATALGMTA
eukprot:2848511-Pyramimonas_sp.AAC.1